MVTICVRQCAKEPNRHYELHRYDVQVRAAHPRAPDLDDDVCRIRHRGHWDVAHQREGVSVGVVPERVHLCTTNCPQVLQTSCGKYTRSTASCQTGLSGPVLRSSYAHRSLQDLGGYARLPVCAYSSQRRK